MTGNETMMGLSKDNLYNIIATVCDNAGSSYAEIITVKVLDKNIKDFSMLKKAMSAAAVEFCNSEEGKDLIINEKGSDTYFDWYDFCRFSENADHIFRKHGFTIANLKTEVVDWDEEIASLPEEKDDENDE